MPDSPSAALILGMRLGLLALVYAFLGTVLWTLWRDMRATARETTRPARSLGRLMVQDGGGSDLRAGESFNLLPVTAIGRDLSNTIVLSDPTVSSEHALISLREGRWWVEDRNSRNGTYVNGARVLRPQVASPGDLIGVGRIQLRLVA